MAKLDKDGDGTIDKSEIQVLEGKSISEVKEALNGKRLMLTDGAKTWLSNNVYAGEGVNLDVVGEAVKAAVSKVFDIIVRPLYRGLLYLGIVMAGAITALFLGSDQELGVSSGSWPGIADIPLFSVELVIDGGQILASLPLSIIESINAEIASAVAGLGVFAPVVMIVVTAVQIVFLGWLLFRTAELLQVEAIVKAATAPARAAWGLLR